MPHDFSDWNLDDNALDWDLPEEMPPQSVREMAIEMLDTLDLLLQSYQQMAHPGMNYEDFKQALKRGEIDGMQL